MENEGKNPVKTLAVRLDEDLHAQLAMLAQLEGVTLTDVVRQAIERYVEHRRGEGDMAAKAEEALAEIDREATARRQAIQTMFGSAEGERPGKRRPGAKGNPKQSPSA